jgi:hypothetical protein
VSRAAARTVVQIDLGSTAPQRATVAPTGRLPRVARLLALAHRIDGMVRNGEIKDLADAARRLGLTRARVTQLINLLLLAPAIQEEILALPPVRSGRDPVTERQLRRIVAEAVWNDQFARWQTVRSRGGS